MPRRRVARRVLPQGLEALAAVVALGAVAATLAGTWQAARGPRLPPPTGWRPFATVIVPCKGEHPGLAENAAALLAQDYGPHEVLFVLDDAADASAPALRSAVATAKHARLVWTRPDLVGDGWATGKIVAQLTGVRAGDPRSEVFVFADADARPPPGWLGALVDPLGHADVGGVTGYRWYTAASRATAWSALRDAWNAVGLDALSMERFRFLWGGSMAVRRADFDRSAVHTQWRTTVSEDVGLTRAVRALGLGLAFTPAAMVASPEDWTPAQVKEWVVRQAALTRASMPGVFRFAGAVYALSVALLVVGLALVGTWPSPLWGWLGTMMLVPVASALPRAWLRERMIRATLPAARAQPRRERALQLGMSLVVPGFMLWALHRARRQQAIEWRGRRYELKAPAEPARFVARARAR